MRTCFRGSQLIHRPVSIIKTKRISIPQDRILAGHRASRARRRFRIASALMLCCGLGSGCNRGANSGNAPKVAAPDDVLRNCAAAYGRIKTIQMSGVLRDDRPENVRTVPISWDFEQPQRCRLQVGMDVAVSSGDRWWTYRADRRQYLTHRQRSPVAMKLASLQLSEGIDFLLPELLANSSNALGLDQNERSSRWQFEGVAWAGKRPCYVFHQPSNTEGDETDTRIWIDQDSFLLCQWTLEKRTPSGRRRLIAMCHYFQIISNQPLAPNRFRLEPPDPIYLPPEVLDEIDSSLAGPIPR